MPGLSRDYRAFHDEPTCCQHHADQYPTSNDKRLLRRRARRAAGRDIDRQAGLPLDECLLCHHERREHDEHGFCSHDNPGLDEGCFCHEFR